MSTTASGVNPGVLRHRLLLEGPVETPDGSGGTVRSFAGEASLWGLIQPLGGTEARQQDRLAQRLTHRILLRRREGLTAAHRLRRGTRLFDIRAVLEDVPKRGYLTCHCEETSP
ncbi:phage head closure protein [Phreatobacter sp.]|uniref:phage head closure protein n=1 Tax=Phreatobacter sp. TaxID=1966341 RepID=UPI003F70B3C4